MQHLVASGQLDSLSAIAQYIVAVAQEAGLDRKSSYKLRLAVDEIATNIIIHGYTEAGINGELDIRADITDQELMVSMEDTGAVYDPTEEEEPLHLCSPLEQRPCGGLGVYLALQSVDRFIHERIGSINRNVFIVKRPENSLDPL
ncbi:ATP-binding protein [Roseofilum sp. BLCC_M154]|uniref:ATP-binding protein n=1 Tax=Roseofilum acuticapitatum BLCC-M154 TaxID=3022444 RepID=A0ABT7AT16_9CYAN|nr:ATP-binding protein [Roseofilum acuticapitatum]MDJ1169446.1 ATP-binding protein [Roseofilum acuticapitatum BLCC-M154]